DFLVIRPKGIIDMNGVLTVNEQKAFLDEDSIDLVPPDWDLIFETKFSHEMPGLRRFLRLACFFASDLNEAAILETNVLGEMIEHDGAAEWRRQGGDEQAVIPPGHDSGNGARGITAQAVGQEPFAA